MKGEKKRVFVSCGDTEPEWVDDVEDISEGKEFTQGQFTRKDGCQILVTIIKYPGERMLGILLGEGEYFGTGLVVVDPKHDRGGMIQT